MKPWSEIAYLPSYQDYSISQETINSSSRIKQPLVDWNTLVLDPLKKIATKLLNIIPNLIEALYVLLAGWIMAHIVQFFVRKVLHFIRFDMIAEKTGIGAILKDLQVTLSPSVWFSKLAYWVIMVGAILTALDELKFGAAVFQVDQIAAFVFAILEILIIFLIGLFMGNIVSRIVHTTAQNLKVDKAQGYSTIVKWVILAFTVFLILRRLMVPMDFILIVLAAVFVTLCLTFVIAFGTGGSQWAAKVLNKFIK